MFGRNIYKRQSREVTTKTPAGFILQRLEDRKLLSATVTPGTCVVGYAFGPGFGSFGNTAEFSELSTAIQGGLDGLATNAGLTGPAATSTQTVYLGNRNGVETYSIDLTDSSGNTAPYTVDENGMALVKPTVTSSTWAVLSGTSAGSNAAATAEFTAIFTAENLTAPIATTVVQESTDSGGTTTYTIDGASATATPPPGGGGPGMHGGGPGFGSHPISVDSNGNPVGFESIPFSAIPTAIQGYLNSMAPAGTTALASTSTQPVQVSTPDGVTTYSTTYTAPGLVATVSVDANDNPISLPTPTATTFGAITIAAVTSELNLIAGDDGATSPIAGTTAVNQYTEINGTVLYSVTVTATTTTANGNTYTHPLTITVDAAGNPTVQPGDGGGGFGMLFGPGGPLQGLFNSGGFGGLNFESLFGGGH